MTDRQKKKTVILKPSSYHPTKAELEEEIKLDFPGDTV